MDNTGSSPSAAGNMITASDAGSLGFAVVDKSITSMNKGIFATLKNSQLIEKTWKSIHKFASMSARIFGITGRGGGASSLGMGAMPNTGPLSGQQKLGLAAGIGTTAAVAAPALFMGLMPNTMAAVTQRMAAETTAGVSGMAPRQMILGANKIIARGNGATSAYSPTMAASAMLYQGGVAFGSKGSKNIFGALSGLSALTGGTNEQIAGGYASWNSNNMFSLGIRTRDSKGEQRKPHEIINELWRVMYGGKKVTKEQVAIVFTPGSPSNLTVMNAANGSPEMFSVLANGLLAKATTSGEVRNLTAKSLASSGAALDLAGVPKNSIFRANFRNNTAQNKALGATEKGLSEGYMSAVNLNASATQNMAGFAQEIQGATDALMKFKGFLQTMPSTGGVGGGIASAVQTAGSFALQMAVMKKMMGGGPLFVGPKGGGGAKPSGLLGPNGMPLAAATTTAAGPGFMSFLTRGGKLTPTGVLGAGSVASKVGRAGLALGVYAGGEFLQKWLNKKGKNLPGWAKWAGNFAYDLGQGALTGLAAGGLPGAIAGTAAGGIGNLATGTGMGGDNPSAGSSSGGKTSGLTLQPPVKGPISSDFGPRQAAHDKNPEVSAKHSGIDYAVPVGTSVAAAGDGIVTETGLHRQYGNYVIIKHGRKSTLYAHLSKIMVGTGKRVKGGETIALSGGRKGSSGAGSSTGPHVHFEVRNNGGVAAQGRENPHGFFGQLVSSLKSAGTTGLNMIKKAVNTVTGKDIFSYSNTASNENPFDFSRTSDVIGINNTSIASAMKYAYRSGAPISFADIQGSTEGGGAGSYSFNAKIPGKNGEFINTNVNANVDPGINKVSGDKGGMGGGSRAGLIRLLYNAGFKGKALETAFAVALAESGGRTHAHNGVAPDDSYGMFQINMIGDLKGARLSKKWRSADGSKFKLSNVEDLYDPMLNAKVAYHMTKHGTNWSRWSTYTGGKFVEFLDDARTAAIKAKIPSYDVGTKRVPKDQIATVHKDEMILTAKEAEKVRNAVSPSGGSTANINVNMKVTLNNSSPQQAQQLLAFFKKQLKEELKSEGLGIF
jgi:murein DD-endopeptidase MepM/ murein hydrolase activator NlpD